MFKSVKNEMNATFKTLLKYSYRVPKACPKCHHMTIIQPGPIDKATGRHRVAPVCVYPGCGWRKNAEEYTRAHRKEATSQARQMRYSEAVGYFTEYSAQESDNKLQSMRFNNYKINGVNQQKVKQNAKKLADRLSEGQPIHSMLVGRTGTGKTHLAYAIVNRIFQRTSYRKKILFLNMLKLSILQNKAITDITARKWFNSLLSQVNKADLVVLDDLGREKTNRWNQVIVALVAGDRTDKPLLITSNLQDGLQRYSQQVRDRILPSTKYSINFNGIPSYRKIHADNAVASSEAKINGLNTNF